MEDARTHQRERVNDDVKLGLRRVCVFKDETGLDSSFLGKKRFRFGLKCGKNDFVL